MYNMFRQTMNFTVWKSNADLRMLSEGDKFILLMTFEEKGSVHCLARYICMSAMFKIICLWFNI